MHERRTLQIPIMHLPQDVAMAGRARPTPSASQTDGLNAAPPGGDQGETTVLTSSSRFVPLSVWIRRKLRTRFTWVGIMFLLGTSDMLMQWVNLADLSSPQQEHGLVLGPPTYITWVTLFSFTILGTVAYIPETINTFSVFFRDGQTLVPLTLELLATLTLEHIPLSAISYVISNCRISYASVVQTGCGALRILFVFVRLLWYAHLEGKMLMKHDETKLKKGFFMLCCALYAFTMAFPVMVWRERPSLHLSESDVRNVSIYLLKAPMLQQGGLSHLNIDYLLRKQGRSLEYPYVIRSLTPIFERRDHGVHARYTCNLNASHVPKECLDTEALCLKFIYVPNAGSGPYGQILYNFAKVSTSDTFTYENTTSSGVVYRNLNNQTAVNGTAQPVDISGCRQSRDALMHGWGLHYFNTEHKSSKPIQVFNPWKGTCTNPTPRYDPNIDVCSYWRSSECAQ